MKGNWEKTFRIVKDKHDGTWVVARADTNEDKHAHFQERNGCFSLISLYFRGIKPYDPYYREAMRRITFDDEWRALKEEHGKEPYNNHHRGKNNRKQKSHGANACNKH